METMKVQAQIRQNAEEVSSYLSDMSKWEKSINKRVPKKKITSVDPKALPVRLGSGTVKVVERIAISSGAKHPARNEAEDEDFINNTGVGPLSDSLISSELTPASLATRAPQGAVSYTAVPAARGVANLKDAETAERERGNTEFEGGNFTAAIKSYTKCLGLKISPRFLFNSLHNLLWEKFEWKRIVLITVGQFRSKNYIAFSNRAMAYIRLKEFIRAESDCISALSIEPTHVKSLIRRATSRNALGKHRAALQDLTAAMDLEPTNKQVRGELQRTRELLRSAVNRAPLVSVPTVWLGDDSNSENLENLAGPDLPYTPCNLGASE